MCKRILVVDDEEVAREILDAMLTYEGYQCHCVPNGADALKLLDAGERFDLITSDVANTPMWGTEFVIEARRRFPDVPILIITACSDLSDSPACVPKGIYDGYVRKPYERAQLMLAVRRAMESKAGPPP